MSSQQKKNKISKVKMNSLCTIKITSNKLLKNVVKPAIIHQKYQYKYGLMKMNWEMILTTRFLNLKIRFWKIIAHQEFPFLKEIVKFWTSSQIQILQVSKIGQSTKRIIGIPHTKDPLNNTQLLNQDIEEVTLIVFVSAEVNNFLIYSQVTFEKPK